MYEHFCIVGLAPTTDVKAVSADIRTARRASTATGGGIHSTSRIAPSVGDLIDIVPDTSDSGTKQYGIKGPVLSAEVLTVFPATPQLPEDLAHNIAAFCFPHGVRPELLERTPSMSGLNEVVFGQPYQTQSDHSFVFRMSVAEPGDPTPRPLYGVCCYAKELVHRPPALARDSFPQSNAPLARYMVTAPRCYCLLTRYPFFELHFRVLHTVLGLERLDRMSTFAGEVALGLITGVGNNSIMRYSSVNDTISHNSRNSTTTTTTNGTNSTSIEEEDASYAALGIQHQYHHHHSTTNATSNAALSNTTAMTSSTTATTEVTPAIAATSSDDDYDDEEGFSGRLGVGVGPDTSSTNSSTGFATPMHASTEEQEIDNAAAGGEEEEEDVEGILERKATGASGGTVGNLNKKNKKKVVQLSRGLSEGTECEGLLSPVASTSSIGSDLAATPSAPLLPATPFFTPGYNSGTGVGGFSMTSRRMTKYHGMPSPGPDPLLLLEGEEEDAGEAGVLHSGCGGCGGGSGGSGSGSGGSSSQQQDHADLLGRMESVKQLLDDSLIELDTRLRPSPPSLPPLQPQIQNGVVLESVDLISSSLELGNWVGATDDQGQPIEEAQEQEEHAGSNSSSNQNDLENVNGLSDSLAALLTLTPPFENADAGGGGGGEDTTPAITTTTTTDNDTNTANSTLDALDVLQQYLDTAVPPPGESVGFQPDPALHPMVYQRPAWIPRIQELGLRIDAPALPDIDAAANLSAWTISALCQSLSLESILTFFSAVLLERQVVLFCPNVGVLCGVALSLVPLLLPFSWQSLLLPVLPATASRLDLLEAPVPFVVGVLFKTQDVRSRCGGLVRVNIYKDRVKNANSLPALPNAAELIAQLAGPHAELQRAGRERAAAARPVHVVSEAQAAAAQSFSSILRGYLKCIVADLEGYTITDVSEGAGEQQRVSVLLKDSFLDSFPPRDRAFMRQFAETQMFSVYCDSVLG
jgi:DENN (AEX-3) domain